MSVSEFINEWPGRTQKECQSELKPLLYLKDWHFVKVQFYTIIEIHRLTFLRILWHILYTFIRLQNVCNFTEMFLY